MLILRLGLLQLLRDTPPLENVLMQLAIDLEMNAIQKLFELMHPFQLV
jgi:hypothetical protein